MPEPHWESLVDAYAHCLKCCTAVCCQRGLTVPLRLAQLGRYLKVHDQQLWHDLADYDKYKGKIRPLVADVVRLQEPTYGLPAGKLDWYPC